MSFLANLFGGGSSSGCDADGNCDCNKELKDHLRKCAGLGERPPVKNCCDFKNADPSKALDLSGPPTCSGCTPAPENCSTLVPKKLVVFIPKCNVPPTATFKCPDGACCEKSGESKPECCSPPPSPADGCNNNSNKDKANKNCPVLVTADGQPAGPTSCPAANKGGGGCGCGSKSSSGSSGSGSWCGNENSCDPKPLKM